MTTKQRPVNKNTSQIQNKRKPLNVTLSTTTLDLLLKTKQKTDIPISRIIEICINAHIHNITDEEPPSKPETLNSKPNKSQIENTIIEMDKFLMHVRRCLRSEPNPQP